MSDLKIVEVKAYQLEWKGTAVSDVYFTRSDIEEYRTRWEKRYSTESTRDLLAAAEASDPIWELRWPAGERGDGEPIYKTLRVQAKYQKDAKELARERLGRSRLPNGYELEKVR